MAPGFSGKELRVHELPVIVLKLLTVLLSLTIVVWQLLVVKHNSESWPSSLWTGRHPEMNDSCRKLFLVLHWSAFASIFILIADVLLFIVKIVPAIALLCLPCVCCLYVLDLIAGIGKFAFSTWGMILVLFVVNGSETAGCHDMFVCAWFSFVGFFLVSLAGACLVCCVGALFTHHLPHKEKDDKDDIEVDEKAYNAQMRSGGTGGSTGYGSVGRSFGDTQRSDISSPSPLEQPERDKNNVLVPTRTIHCDSPKMPPASAPLATAFHRGQVVSENFVSRQELLSSGALTEAPPARGWTSSGF